MSLLSLRNKRRIRLAWAMLCLTLAGVFLAGTIPTAPPLPESTTFHNGVLCTFEAVTASPDATFTQPSWLAKTWVGRAWQGLCRCLRSPDSTPLKGDLATLQLNATEEIKPPFIDPALWVWISLRDSKSGKYLETLPPRLRAELWDERCISLMATSSVAAKRADGRPVFGFFWPYFHRKSERFLLRLTQLGFQGECCVEILNPEVSNRQMPWVPKAHAVPDAQMVGDFKVSLEIKEMRDAAYIRGYSGFAPVYFEAKTVHRETGKDLSKLYTSDRSEFYTDAWGVSAHHITLDSERTPVRVRTFLKERPDRMKLPDSQKFDLTKISRPAEGGIISIGKTFGPEENPILLIACLGRGLYRLDRAANTVVKVRPLGAEEIKKHGLRAEKLIDVRELFVKDDSGFPVIKAPASAVDEFYVVEPALLLFKKNKSARLWELGVLNKSGYLLAPLEFRNGKVSRPRVLPAAKCYEVDFYYRPEGGK